MSPRRISFDVGGSSVVCLVNKAQTLRDGADDIRAMVASADDHAHARGISFDPQAPERLPMNGAPNRRTRESPNELIEAVLQGYTRRTDFNRKSGDGTGYGQSELCFFLDDRPF